MASAVTSMSISTRLVSAASVTRTVTPAIEHRAFCAKLLFCSELSGHVERRRFHPILTWSIRDAPPRLSRSARPISAFTALGGSNVLIVDVALLRGEGDFAGRRRDLSWGCRCRFRFQFEACAYLAYLRDTGRSPNIARAYAERIAQFLTQCAANLMDWRTVAIKDLSRFLRPLVSEPLPARSVNSTRGPRFRPSRPANATMTSVSEFLRFAATRGWMDASVTDCLSRPRFLRYRAQGQSWGEDEQFRTVNSRTLSLPESESPVQPLSSKKITSLLKSTVHQRDMFPNAVLDETGMCSGEMLALRREEMHLPSSSTRLGVRCRAHIRMSGNASPRTAR
ncbi:site-specific integrase [Rhodococcus sp. NPDC057135]|uniref:site-specific integrase n=1 Tax=Rhodococcus sp. NPDC057135 TaxID=3346028 RepID=UPI00363C316C